MKNIIVTPNEAGQRLDKLLSKYLNKAPKSFIYKMLRKKNIMLNDKKADGSEKLLINDDIKIYLSDQTIDNFSELIIPQIKSRIDIVYEDSNIIVINKPSGVLSQKAKADDISLVEHIIAYMLESKQLTKEELNSFKPSICNRLDRNTSGLVIAGKTLIGLQTMASILKDRSLEKFYLCIVKGQVLETKKIEGYLLKNEKSNKVSITKEFVEGSSFIETKYEPIKSTRDYTLLNVNLITGRSHQIRAHLSSIKHPIVADSKYGDKITNDYYKKNYKLEHQLLHSHRMIFPEIVGELNNLSKKEIICPIPKLFKDIINDLF